MRRATKCLLVFLLSLIGLGVLTGCDSEKEYAARDLRDLRVLGLLADQPEVSIEQLLPAFNHAFAPDDSFSPTVLSRVRIVDYHPMDTESSTVARSYSWLMCFSLGGFTRFECLTDSQIFPAAGPELAVTDVMIVNAVLSLFSDGGEDDEAGIPLPSPETLMGSDTCMSVPPDACTADSDCAEGGFCEFGVCAAVPDVLSIPLVIRTRVESEDGQVREAVRSLPVRLRGALNQNPVLQALKVDGRVLNFTGVDGCLRVDEVDFSTTIQLEAVLAESAIEAFESIEDGQCTMTTEEDSTFVSWYSTAGELDQGLGRPDNLENEFSGYESDVYGEKIVEELDRARVYIAVRDGRAGSSISCIDFVSTDER